MVALNSILIFRYHVSALVIDTSSWATYFAHTASSVIDEALAEGRVYLPPIVVPELLSGKMTTRQRRQLESFLLDLPLCEHSLEHWMRVGRFRAQLFSKGLSVSTPDAHIAQCSLDLNAELLSEDQVFFKIAQKTSLRLFNLRYHGLTCATQKALIHDV